MLCWVGNLAVAFPYSRDINNTYVGPKYVNHAAYFRLFGSSGLVVFATVLTGVEASESRQS